MWFLIKCKYSTHWRFYGGQGAMISGPTHFASRKKEINHRKTFKCALLFLFRRGFDKENARHNLKS